MFLSAAALVLASSAAAQLAANASAMPSTEWFRRITQVEGDLQLRLPGTPRHYAWVEYLENQLFSIPQLGLSSNVYDLYAWTTLDDNTLYQAANLSLNGQRVDIAGAIPYSQPGRITGELLYVDAATNLTAVNCTGKIVVRDFSVTGLPFEAIFQVIGIYRTPDMDQLNGTSYRRPYATPINLDIRDAINGGAAGYISGFNVSRSWVQSYYDPHDGRHYTIPGVYVGVDELNQLKRANGQRATLTIRAQRNVAYTRELTATLPGKTNETITVLTHTDGNTWVQDDGDTAVLALAQYFALQPQLNKTLKFVFSSGHLTYARDGSLRLARQYDHEYDTSNDVLVVAMEHMGTREILPTAGSDLAFTGKGEPMFWSVGPSTPLIDAATAAVKRRNLDRVIVARGASVPVPGAVPEYASFGGIGTYFHQRLVPTTAIISGPWSLWAPRFGAAAIDFDRLRNQTLAFADLLHAIDGLSKTAIAGNYTQMRQRRATGARTNAPDINPVLQIPQGYFSNAI